MPDDLRWLFPATCALLAIACPIAAEWVRHRPERLTRGTQHIVLLGLLGFLGFGALCCGALAWMYAPR